MGPEAAAAAVLLRAPSSVLRSGPVLLSIAVAAAEKLGRVFICTVQYL